MTEQHHDPKLPRQKPIKLCQEPSSAYLKILEDCGNDPRSVAGYRAIRTVGPKRGWQPDWEARDQR